MFITQTSENNRSGLEPPKASLACQIREMLCMSLEASTIYVTSLWFQPRGCYFFHKETYQSTFFQLIGLLIQFIFQSCDEGFF